MLYITVPVSDPKIYTESQIDKLGNTLIFLCERIKPASKTHLLKLVFIIEEIAIKKFGIPFFDLRFDVWKLGPVSKDLFVELTEEPNLLANYILKTEEDGRSVFSPKKDFSDEEFNDNEIALLTEVVDRFKYCTANELVNFTHRKNTPWYNTAQRHGILDLLESGMTNTTDIEIDLSEIIQAEEEKLALYHSHKEFLRQSQSLKS